MLGKGMGNGLITKDFTDFAKDFSQFMIPAALDGAVVYVPGFSRSTVLEFPG